MSEDLYVSPAIVKKWIAENLDLTSIEHNLKSERFSDDVIVAYVKEYRKQKLGQKQGYGFIVISIGAVLGFVSCVLTLTNPFPELFHAILYGLTSIAVLLIMAGLYLIFE
ncbi:MAG: hypothetical protein EYC69_09710 [Bacteroidetes bacterium]|nr:MAG: hypothetical protein EYC69_09710 [Bacteroidota bacterium]